MRRIESQREEVEACTEKINRICREFNCYIDYDDELQAIIIVDRETLKYEHYC